MNKSRSKLSIRGYLLHITHYDPVWVANKDKEEPFNLFVGKKVIDAMAHAGLNLLIIDPKDGVRYVSHPELTRHYSQNINILQKLNDYAINKGIETAIKLNFSQSALHQHNHWFRPHNDLFDSPKYWEYAFEIIDELLHIVKPRRFFHIGMDEDHARSCRQYVAAIKTLHKGLSIRGLRTLIWNDSACHWPSAEIHRDKSMFAEKKIPKDIIQILWDYSGEDPNALSRISKEGFDLWGAPGGNPNLVKQMRDNLKSIGGTGILLTHWIPCIPSRCKELLERINICGPICSK